jgi:hypothetical protein
MFKRIAYDIEKAESIEEVQELTIEVLELHFMEKLTFRDWVILSTSLRTKQNELILEHHIERFNYIFKLLENGKQ